LPAGWSDGSTAVMWTLTRLQMSTSRRHGHSERGGETKQEAGAPTVADRGGGRRERSDG
jgi:hypothetical protein